MIVGIIIGSFFTAFTSKEFSIVKTDKRIGAVWAKGCLIGNGLVATSQLATRAWLALLFIALGIWFGAWFMYVRGSKSARG